MCVTAQTAVSLVHGVSWTLTHARTRLPPVDSPNTSTTTLPVGFSVAVMGVYSYKFIVTNVVLGAVLPAPPSAEQSQIFCIGTCTGMSSFQSSVTYEVICNFSTRQIAGCNHCPAAGGGGFHDNDRHLSLQMEKRKERQVTSRRTCSRDF